MDLSADLKRKRTIASFQEAMKVTIFAGQFFSLLPVNGCTSKNVEDVKYEKVSLRCLYTVLSLVGQLFMTSFCVRKFYDVGTSLTSTTSMVFYGSSLISMTLFFKMATYWPKLVRDIKKIEDLYPNFDTKLIYKCNITCFIVLTLSALEHLLALVPAFLGRNPCHAPKLLSYEIFLLDVYGWIFDLLPFHLLLGVLFEFLQIQATFVWNFSDLFIICMSYYLTSRLEVVNQKLLDAQGKILPVTFWRLIRKEYGRTTQLVKRVDDVINGVIFVSFANNLFFICMQLYYTLENGIRGRHLCDPQRAGSVTINGYILVAYYLFSLVYLISRSMAVSLIVSQVNTASRVPAQVLYDVPSASYCNDVRRFLRQINGERVALSGLQFFSVTRGLLLTVAGTIVTYELVMFQVSTPEPFTNATIAATILQPNYTTPETFTSN